MMASPVTTPTQLKSSNKSPIRSIMRTPSILKLQPDSATKLTGICLTNDDQRDSKRRRLENSPPESMTADDIRHRATEIFRDPDLCDKIALLPCIVPRLFAAYSISLDKDKRTVHANENSASFRLLKPLLPLLEALVNVELVSLDGQQPISLIYFSGIDCSSTQPPDDRIVGSDSHQHNSILALEVVMARIQLLTMSENPSETALCIDAIIDFLGSELSSICALIARSISIRFPPARVMVVVKAYYREFSKIRQRILHTKLNATPATTLRLALEKRFAELVGQSIRFRLRRLFNDRPPRASAQDVKYDEWTERFSRVNELVTMTLPRGTINAAVEDGCLSAVISAALSTLCQYFGTDFLDLSSPLPELPTGFCERRASNQGLSLGSKNLPCGLTDDPREVMADISDSALYLAASRAANFLSELWNISGVDKEIERCGGWHRVEEYATMSWQFGLWKIVPQDSHLVLLSNFSALKNQLSELAPRMKCLDRNCERALLALSKRFRLSTKSANLLRKCPNIPMAAQHYHDALALANFPVVGTAKETR